jgi:hypothetical protein
MFGSKVLCSWNMMKFIKCCYEWQVDNMRFGSCSKI